MGFWSRLTKMFSSKNIDLAATVQEPINPNFIDDKYIPEVVFDRDVGLYNYGIDKEKNTYRVLIAPLEKEIIV